MNRPSHHHHQAFTLVELSIVLLIIGLIIGAITAGVSLVRQASLRAITAENTNYQTAINTFKLTYNALPGDFSSASTFWPSQQNGNASNILEFNWGSGSRESIYMWGHLTNAGLINGNFPGSSAVFVGNNNYDQPGIASPYSKFGNGAYWTAFNMYSFGGGAQATIWNSGALVNYLILGARESSANSAWGPFIAPADAYGIDVKIDDGLPGKGSVVAAGYIWNSVNNCSSGSTSSATYTLTNTGPQCYLGFQLVAQ